MRLVPLWLSVSAASARISSKGATCRCCALLRNAEQRLLRSEGRGGADLGARSACTCM